MSSIKDRDLLFLFSSNLSPEAAKFLFDNFGIDLVDVFSEVSTKVDDCILGLINHLTDRFGWLFLVKDQTGHAC